VTDAGRLRPDPEPVTAWLQAPGEQQRSALAKSWRDDETWNDLFQVPTLQPEDTGAWHNDPLLARRAILRHLATCQPGAWYALSDLTAAIKAATPDFQRPDGDYDTWYLCDAATGDYLTGFESWDPVEDALIRYVVTGPLAWIGLVDLGGDPPAAFCLTPAGASFLDLAPAPPEPEPDPATIRADFALLVPPARRYQRFQLARIADWALGPGAAPAGSYTFRLTPSSLARARKQGIPITRVLEFLSEVTGNPVPGALETALLNWETHGAQARLERVILLRLASEETAQRVLASPARRLIDTQLGPTTATVRERDWPQLVRTLGENGLLPDIVALQDPHAE
jgi:hypothetical protein